MLTLATALALAPQGFAFEAELEMTGTVRAVPSPLVAPLDAVAIGDEVHLELDLFLSDAPCFTPNGLLGDTLLPLTSSLRIGAADVGFDPMTEPCAIGIDIASGPGVTRLEIDADLEGGLGALRIRLDDPNGAVGVSVQHIIVAPIDAATITDPLFQATFELTTPTGAVAVEVEFEHASAIVFRNSICDVVPNSTGDPTRLFLHGSNVVANNDLVIGAHDLPPQSFVYFLTSQASGFVPNPAGSAGNLCVAGNIGRYVGPGQIMSTGDGGPVELQIDLTAMPQPTGTVAVAPGDRWYFSCWYRDIVGTTTSNFGATIEVSFL